jgi:hypothetical protein
LLSQADTKKATEEYCHIDVNALFQTSVLPMDFKVGDQIVIPLGDLGIFTATAQKVTYGKVLFLFDDYITKRPMNKNGSNKGGYEKSDLKKWIENDLFKIFPKILRDHIFGLSIPTLGEICGWDNEWNREYIEADSDEQLPLMKQRRNRVAYYNDKFERGWLRNATKEDFSSAAFFACVSGYGGASYGGASDSFGVRPRFWLV